MSVTALGRLSLGLALALAALAGILTQAPPAEAAAPTSRPWIHSTNPVHLGFQFYWWDGNTAERDTSVTGYDVEYRETGTTSWISHTHTGTVRAAEISGLTATKVYEVRVRPTNSDGNGRWSRVETTVAATSRATTPNPPFPLVVEAGDSQAKITWGVPSHTGGQTLSGYVIRLRYGNSATELRRITINGAATTSTTVGGLTNNTEYAVNMYATYGEQDEGGITTPDLPFTPTTSQTTISDQGRCNLPGYTPPGLVPITSATPTDNRVVVRWNSPTYGTTSSGRKNMITDFLIWVTTADNSYEQTVITTAEAYEPASYQETISGLSPATTYQIRVNARTITACYSGWSSIEATTTNDMQGAPIPVDRPPPQSSSLEGTAKPPQLVSNLDNVTDLEVQATRSVDLSGVFSAPDVASLTISATSSDEAVVTVSVAADGSSLTLTGQAEGDAAIIVAAEDANGYRADTEFGVTVVARQPQAPEPTPTTEPDGTCVSKYGIAAQYDVNGNDAIDSGEYLAAMSDYQSGKLTYDGLVQVVQAMGLCR